MEKKTIDENGISVTVKPDSDKPGKCKTFYNPVMKICRELVLSCLAAYTEPLESTVKCLDAFGATGIGGMQWKHHLAEKVHVCINEVDSNAVDEIKDNCSRNELRVMEDQKEVISDNIVNPEATPASVEILHGDANVLMHQRQFHFIHLDPYGTTVQFLDAAFRNIYNTGVMVITSTDIASLYGKCPQVTLRNYSAYTLKTDYNKEVAARIVLAVAARAAARCNKGLKVLYCAAVEHFVQVAVQVCRGTQKADTSLGHIRKVLHCQMCEEWALLPDSKAPVESPYSLLPCDCQSQNPGKTAVELGPLWAGSLYDANFVTQMHKHSKKLSLSERAQTLTECMQADAECRRRKTQPVETQNQEQTTSNSGVKRPATPHEDSTPAKRARPNRELSCEDIPLFYYNLFRRKIKGGNLPKFNKLVSYLHHEGFRACRTPFEPEAIRTDATLKELVDIVLKNGPNS